MPPKTPIQMAEAYTAKLLPISTAAKMFGISESTFWRLRRKYGVKSLPGRRVHIADIITAMERQRLAAIQQPKS